MAKYLVETYYTCSFKVTHYLDDINEKLFVKGSRKLAKEVLEVDSKVVDGVVNLTGLPHQNSKF